MSTLIVAATISITKHIFVDSVNFIVHICDMKIKQIYHYLLLKNSLVISVVNLVPSKFKSLLQEALKVVLHSGLNVYSESTGDSRSVTNSLLLCYKWSQRRSHCHINYLCTCLHITVYLAVMLQAPWYTAEGK